MDADELVAWGGEALTAGRWDDARAAFEAAVAADESPAALLGLAESLWWLADAPACVAHMERAYTLLRRAGEDAEAVVTAVWLAVIYKKGLGNQAACSGWANRAEGLVGDGGPAVPRGWVALARAFECADPERACAAGREALRIARAEGDADLELCALGELGRALVASGEVAEGLACVDEAMAGALGGEYRDLGTVVAATCSMLVACDLAADLDRVREWCRVADRFMRTYGCPFLFADCRMRYGSVLLATGHWDSAERELESALRSAPAETDYYRQALVRLGELRLRQGRLEEADALLGDATEPAAWPVAAALRHILGEHEVAVALLERHVETAGAADAAVLGLLVEAHLARGDHAAARATAERLGALAHERADQRRAGHAAFAAGRVAFAGGAGGEAVTAFERAMEHFSDARLPYETARARLALAEALAADQPAVAISEAQGACATFGRLGATRDADGAAALLRSLGAPARTGPKDVGVLTDREREVLRLLGAGLSNPEIAERLFISRKTASHHVSSVLAKLGLRNRAEAAAYATRSGAR